LKTPAKQCGTDFLRIVELHSLMPKLLNWMGECISQRCYSLACKTIQEATIAWQPGITRDYCSGRSNPLHARTGSLGYFTKPGSLNPLSHK
jgi:hypothetical protein